MFTRKPEDGSGSQGDGDSTMRDGGGSGRLPLRSRAPGDIPPALPAKPAVERRDIVHRARDYGAQPGQERAFGGLSGGRANESKELVVGPGIALSGAISSCEKLVVEGRVEANITECLEIEIAEGGFFKGEATIDVAIIGGEFEGSLIARNLLVVHGSGKISGNVRYGQIEIERGGQIDGDVRLIAEDGSASESSAD